MVPLHGRSPRGTRAHGSAPFGYWTRVTVLGALGAEGIVGAEAATVFHARLDQVLLPALRRTKPDAVLAMGNLPAYSAGLNPIEPAWAEVEAELRRIAARTADALHGACGPALAAITARDAAGSFRHCGCARPG